ncbi:MAG: transporter substrate-binding domain-containing protein, partial [Eubacteriaceae bacterium]|nr:transporter substrate-binding domain-containing protein [Eubacteriaceae bacterium]
MKRITALLLALLLIFSFAACGQKKEEEKPAADSLVETIKARGKLIVGTEAQYAPYEYKNADADFAGCDIWLAQQIADALGVELEIVDMAFDGIIPAVQAGQVDLGIAAFTRTDERAEVIDFSDLYEESRQLLVVAAGNAD